MLESPKLTARQQQILDLIQIARPRTKTTASPAASTRSRRANPARAVPTPTLMRPRASQPDRATDLTRLAPDIVEACVANKKTARKRLSLGCGPSRLAAHQLAPLLHPRRGDAPADQVLQRQTCVFVGHG